MEKINRIPVNNKQYIRIVSVEDGIDIYKENENGDILTQKEHISGGNFISMLNWYRYQKQQGNNDLIF